jgi:prepilin-type N-terminal cleavage/methylation domain-containing protein
MTAYLRKAFPGFRPPRLNAADSGNGRSDESGYTVIELIIVVWLIAIVSTIALGVMDNRIEQARLARCFVDIRSIQTTLWSVSDGMTWPMPDTFWQWAWAGKKPGPYFYLPNNVDRNSGHGNDFDICDEENPGKSEGNRDCKDVEFVVICQHNHRHLANYVYIEDEGPPFLAGYTRDTDPGYERWLDYVYGRN